MKVAILDQLVRRNIGSFKHLLEKRAQMMGRTLAAATKTYRAYVNRRTGDIVFEAPTKKTKEWKEITILMSQDTPTSTFEVTAVEDPLVFACDLETRAEIILSKTISILNQIAYNPKGEKDPNWIERSLSQLKLEPFEEGDPERLLLQAFHDVDREGAEKLLSGIGMGRYLFRKDTFAGLLEETFSRELEEPISCYTLDYTSREERVVEHTICVNRGRWYFYQDDPLFRNNGFSSLRGLLESIGRELSRPLLFKEVA